MNSNRTSNKVSQSIAGIISLGRNAYVGALAVGAEIDLMQNTAARIGANLHDVIGNPATPTILGKQAAFAEQIVVVKEAYTAKQAALSAGREFCRLAINLLRPFLGNEWNTTWKAAGFDKPSLALPRQPAALLTALRSYFIANPAHENAIAGITAEAAEAKASAWDAAVYPLAEDCRPRTGEVSEIEHRV